MRLDRPLVQIRERPLLDQLDLALVVVRRRPWAVLAAAAAGILPFLALNAALIAALPGLEPWWPLLAIAEAPLATGPLTVVLGGMMFGQRPGPGWVAADVARGLPALIWYGGVIRTMALGSVIFAPILADRLAHLDEIILLERARAGRVWGRAGDLARGGAGEGVGRGVALLLFGGLFTASLWWGLPRLAEALVDRWTLAQPDGPLATLGLYLGVWGTIAFGGIARFLGYIDRRIGLEGWELELRLRTAAELLENDRRW